MLARLDPFNPINNSFGLQEKVGWGLSASYLVSSVWAASPAVKLRAFPCGIL